METCGEWRDPSLHQCRRYCTYRGRNIKLSCSAVPQLALEGGSLSDGFRFAQPTAIKGSTALQLALTSKFTVCERRPATGRVEQEKVIPIEEERFFCTSLHPGKDGSTEDDWEDDEDTDGEADLDIGM